jgi:hypothetical protein
VAVSTLQLISDSTFRNIDAQRLQLSITIQDLALHGGVGTINFVMNPVLVLYRW